MFLRRTPDASAPLPFAASLAPVPPVAPARSRKALCGRALGAVVAAASAAALLAGPAAPRADAAPSGSYRVSGIDTSHHNHPGDQAIDWARVRAAGHAFMFAKATEGATEQDRWFARDMQGAKEAGLIRGAYHLYGRTPGAEQARNLVKAMKSAGYTGRAAGELPPAIDLELRDGTACPANFSAGQLRDFLRVVDDELGVRPIVYTTPSFVNTCMRKDGSPFRGHLLWQPRYRSGQAEPKSVPGAGAEWTFWQHSEEGVVTGTPKTSRTDLDVFRGTRAELRRLAHLPS
ncbi:glycoside hydrolase family 25 protein [Streptomyces sp. NPDC060184]|uniref:glycoside hydrolase family 25 protein n=1 Tax=Streptomyces sp. NPDC060184 TaxID=3347064 RepID=UPI003653955A